MFLILLNAGQNGQAWLISGADKKYLDQFVQGWIDVMTCTEIEKMTVVPADFVKPAKRTRYL